MKITITIQVTGNPFAKNCWQANPTGWTRRQRKQAATYIQRKAGDNYVRQVKTLKDKAKESKFDLGLADAVKIIKRMHKGKLLKRKTYDY